MKRKAAGPTNAFGYLSRNAERLRWVDCRRAAVEEQGPLCCASRLESVVLPSVNNGFSYGPLGRLLSTGRGR